MLAAWSSPWMVGRYVREQLSGERNHSDYELSGRAPQFTHRKVKPKEERPFPRPLRREPAARSGHLNSVPSPSLCFIVSPHYKIRCVGIPCPKPDSRIDCFQIYQMGLGRWLSAAQAQRHTFHHSPYKKPRTTAQACDLDTEETDMQIPDLQWTDILAYSVSCKSQ